MSIESADNILHVKNSTMRISRVEVGQTLSVGNIEFENTTTLTSVTSNGNNTTPYTISSSNVTTGLATTANVVVGGELTVSGNTTMSSNLEVGTANLFVNPATSNVGIGTNAPMGTLDVKGVLNHTQVANVAQITSNSNVVMEYRRSKKLIKYPRVAMTSASQGGYTASASSEASATYPAFKAFDNSINFHTDSWEQSGSSFTASTGYLTSPGTEPTTNGIAGPWIQIELPHTILLSSWSFRSLKHPSLTNVGRDRSPQDGYLFGSTDGSTWSIIENWTDRTTWEDGKALTFNVSTNTYYKYFRLVWTRTRPGGSYSHLATVTELQFFGLPEYDPEAHGTDVVLHTTPNVPNTDFSNVYYDGQDYTSMPATVADKSGNGVTGTPSGGVGFDSTYKAFTFDGVDDKITSFLTNPAGAWVHSTSSWFKINSYGSGNAIYSIDNDTTPVANQSPDFSIMPDGDIRYAFGANDIRFGGPGTIVPNKWYHIVSIYSGGSDASSRQVFLNGVELGQTDVYQAAALNGQANMILRIGVYANGSSYLNGSIANFRLYNQALSADEIWELYAYQKEYFGVSPDVVTLKAGRLGIGTSEPRAVLDVRGSSRFDTITIPRALFNPGYSRSAILYTGGYYRTKYQNVHEYYQNLLIPPASEIAGYSIDAQWYTLSNYTSGNSLNTTIIDSLVYWLKNRQDGHIHESQFIVSGGTHFERVYGQKFATHFRLWGYGERSNHTHTKYYVSNYNVSLTSAAELNIYYSETVL
jgi:hypothetical protein